MVGFKESVRRGFKGTFDMSGRATRAEYWWYTLFHMIWFLPVLITSEFSGATADVESYAPSFIGSLAGVIVSALTLTVFVRRCHDIGLSGWWVIPSVIMSLLGFAYFLPGALAASTVQLFEHWAFIAASTVYGLATFIFCVLRSKAGANQYGPNPHTGDVPSTFD